jgi:thioredoxin 1
MAENVVELTDATFDAEVLQSRQPVLVDFWSPTCGPCRRLAPIVDELASENAGKVKVGKVDVDECRQVAMQFQIAALPTLLVFKDGEVQERIPGVPAKTRIQEALDSVATDAGTT